MEEPHEDFRTALNNAKLTFGPKLKGAAHITRGGIKANTTRLFPKDKKLTMTIESLPENPLFNYLQEKGDIPKQEMDKTFNRGIGVVFVVDKECDISNLPPYYHLIGKVIKQLSS